MPSDLTGAPGRGAGATAGAGSGTGPPDDDDGDGGSRSSGFIRAAGVLLGVVALLVLAILLLMWTRASQRNALQRLARHLGDGRPALLLGVEEQAARGGSLQTRISVADADAAGRPGPPRDLWVQGEEVSIDTARVRVRPSPLDGEPIEAVVFRTVGPPRASGASRQSLVPPAGPPAWAVYRGEDGSAVERQERHFWEAVRRGVSGAADSPGWATEVGAADGVDLALALGDRWSLEIGRDGRVHAERIRGRRS